MLWFEHIVINRLILREWSIWSIVPDIPMCFLCIFTDYKWDELNDWWMYNILYKIPHSFLILYIIPIRFRYMYALHICLDILSHTGKWSIQPLYPLHYNVKGFGDSYQFISTYI
jgi:hypothetical protein